jgi:hypothetical protein
MKLALILFALAAASGCGIKIDGPGDVRVIHEVNVEGLIPYISAYCGLANEEPEDLQACIDQEIGKLISKL